MDSNFSGESTLVSGGAHFTRHTVTTEKGNVRAISLQSWVAFAKFCASGELAKNLHLLQWRRCQALFVDTFGEHSETSAFSLSFADLPFATQPRGQSRRPRKRLEELI